MKEKITIVIPVYNRANVVERTLQSVAWQTYRPLRLILIDNASSDDTLSVLHGWRDFIMAQKLLSKGFEIEIASEETPGAAAARNKGLAMADTEWTMFFDSDDVMHPRHVENAMTCANQNPEAQLIGWNVLYSKNGKSAVKPFAGNHALYHGVMRGTMATQRYMARTDLFLQAGGWNPDIKRWNDIEMGVRLLQEVDSDKIIKIKSKPTVDVLFSESSITGKEFASQSTRLEQAIDAIENALPDSMSWLPNLKRIALAADYRREGAKEKAQALLQTALDNVQCPKILKLAYLYAAAGGRGMALLLQPFASKL